MTERSKYQLTALGTLAILVAWMLSLGIFSKDRIVVTPLATTGPHFKVVLGTLKLTLETPDSIDVDVTGVMVSDKSMDVIDNYLQNNYRAFDDYFLLTVRILGLKQSDGPSYHPLIEIHDWWHISKSVFWLSFMLVTGCFVVFVRSIGKYIKLRNHEFKKVG